MLWLRSRPARHVVNLALIVSILLVVPAPFVLILSYIVTAAAAEPATAGSQILAFFAPGHSVHPHGGEGFYNGSYFPDRTLILRLMPWTVEFLSAGMAILLWGLSSATTGPIVNL